MPRKYIIIFSAIFVMVGHVAILPYIYLFLDNAQMSEKHDLAMLVAPLTAAYFITITKYIIDNSGNLDLGSDTVNMLYAFTSVLVIAPFMLSIFYILYSFNKTDFGIDQTKGAVALVEVFFGGAFALFVDNLFGKRQ